jgi:NAD(P)-dependent dehydrogenase (short-subunit alcohol dehydrogenase family)
VRFFNVEPGFIVTEMVKATGLLEQFGPQWRGAPPGVPAAVIAWLVDDDGGLAWHGRTVSAQKLCKDLGLVPGWPPPSPKQR